MHACWTILRPVGALVLQRHKLNCLQCYQQASADYGSCGIPRSGKVQLVVCNDTHNCAYSSFQKALLCMLRVTSTNLSSLITAIQQTFICACNVVALERRRRSSCSYFLVRCGLQSGPIRSRDEHSQSRARRNMDAALCPFA